MCTESTWEYLSKNRSFLPLEQQDDASDNAWAKREHQGGWIKAVDTGPKASPEFSEIQLHQIKTGLGLIEDLWQDFSMGANHVSYSQFLSGHKCVKEIGKELFSNIFIEQTLPAQVDLPPVSRCRFIRFRLPCPLGI